MKTVGNVLMKRPKKSGHKKRQKDEHNTKENDTL